MVKVTGVIILLPSISNIPLAVARNEIEPEPITAVVKVNAERFVIVVASVSAVAQATLDVAAVLVM